MFWLFMVCVWGGLWLLFVVNVGSWCWAWFGGGCFWCFLLMVYDYLPVWASLVLGIVVVAVACLCCCMVAVWFGCSGLE